MDKQNIWDMEEPIATNLEELKQLKDHVEDLKGKVVTVKGIKLDESLADILYEISYNGEPKIFCFTKCTIDTTFSVLGSFFFKSSSILALNDCDLTPKKGIKILKSLNPYCDIKLDLSNNKIGGNGCKEFIKYIKHVVTSGIAGFSYLNLSNNGFDEEDIDDVKEFEKMQYCTIVI